MKIEKSQRITLIVYMYGRGGSFSYLVSFGGFVLEMSDQLRVECSSVIDLVVCLHNTCDAHKFTTADKSKKMV